MSKRKAKKEDIVDYIKSGHVAYGVKFDARGKPSISAVPERGMATFEELLAFLEENDIKFYVERNTDDDDFDSVGNNIDGEAVDLEVEEWLGQFQYDGRNRLSTPLTLIHIPTVDIELGAGTSPEEVVILGDLLGLVAELRLIKGLEAGQSLDEAIM